MNAVIRWENDIVSVLTSRAISERDLPPVVRPKLVGVAKHSEMLASDPQASSMGLVSALARA